MKKSLASLLLLLLVMGIFTACGTKSGGSGGGAIVVSVTPNTNPVSVGAGLTQQFMASVSNTSNQAVTWSVSGGGCTGAACGTIDASGLFTAPQVIPTPQTVTVTATSQADTTKIRNVNVRVIPIVVTVLPASATVALTGTQQFTAQTNPPDTVTWSVSGAGCSGAACGTVDPTGKYTAPAVLPNPASASVIATSVHNPTSATNAAVTLVSSTAGRFNGQYAFRFSGFDANGAVYSAGTFHADGAGNIMSGVEDVNSATGVSNLAFSGTYTVGTDNRGTMTLTANSVTSTYDIAIGAGGETLFIEADATGTTGSGIIDKATSTDFFNSRIAGPYVMSLFGSDLNGKRVGAAVLFNNDGATPGMVTSGALDFNINGTHSSSATLSGTYAVANNGRGTMQVVVPSVGTFNFSFYVVSANELFIVSTDAVSASNPRVFGFVLSQDVSVTYTNATLSSNMVFNLAGLSSSGGDVVAVGIVGADGAGNVTTASVFDENNAGSISAPQTALTGTYTVQPSGVGTLTFSSANPPASQFVLYALTNNKAFLLDVSSNNALSGFMEPQVSGAGGIFSPATIQGAFVTATTSTPNSTAANISGILSLDGSSIISGKQDPSNQNFAATYAVSTNGRGTMTVTAPAAQSRVLYIINGSKFVAIKVNNGDSSATVVESQR